MQLTFGTSHIRSSKYKVRCHETVALWRLPTQKLLQETAVLLPVENDNLINIELFLI